MNPSFKLSSKLVIFLTLVWCIFQFFVIKRWSTDYVWQNEMKSYYAYLPALFVLHDIGFEKTEMTPQNIERYYEPKPAPVRGYVLKTTMGVAVMQAPFFITAHSIALNGGNPEDGFSEVYKQLAMLAGIFYGIAGLMLVRKSLLYFFSDVITSLVLVTLFAGTNLYFYTLHEACMSHVYSFFLVSTLVYLTISWHRNPVGWRLLLLGFVLGLITLIRPVNISLVLFFLLYKDAAQETWKEKYVQVLAQWKYIVGAGLIFFLPLFPQMAYWKYLTGNWVYYSYGHESFFWFDPKIMLGLFSYQKGWLVWTPIMWFAIVGLFLLYRKTERRLFLPVLVCVFVYVYIIFSWWCWWYGGGFGMRPMIDVMPILAFPLAAFLSAVFRTKIMAYPIMGLWLFLVGLNLFQTGQYVAGKQHWAGTTKKVYWALFLNNSPQEDLRPEIKEPDTEKALRGETGL